MPLTAHLRTLRAMAVLALAGWATSAFATSTGNRELHYALVRDAMRFELMLGLLCAVACGAALRRRRWWLAGTFLALVASVPGVIVASDMGVSLELPVWHAELASFLWLGPLEHGPGVRWSHGSRLALLLLCGALLGAEWSRWDFAPRFLDSWELVRLLLIPLWSAWLWLSSWVLARPLLRGFGGWRSLSLVERRALLVGLLGAAPLAFLVVALSSLRVLGSILGLGTAVGVMEAILRG